ncbi:ATP-binding protein [Streptomyces qinglanensis]|uniref:ATP-binding protein n=1 Tax=Streptomyces qinglanensis TaxID=943816 RepID=UPI003D74693E
MSAATTFGTGTMDAEQPLRYTQRGNGILTTHVAAQADVLSALRADARHVLQEVGVAEGVIDVAQLVISELVGNAVNAFGDGVRLHVEIHTDAHGITIGVTDPEPDRLPQVGPTELDSADTESGRGLTMLGLLCEAVDLHITERGKRVRCQVAR